MLLLINSYTSIKSSWFTTISSASEFTSSGSEKTFKQQEQQVKKLASFSECWAPSHHLYESPGQSPWLLVFLPCASPPASMHPHRVHTCLHLWMSQDKSLLGPLKRHRLPAWISLLMLPKPWSTQITAIMGPSWSALFLLMDQCSFLF